MCIYLPQMLGLTAHLHPPPLGFLQIFDVSQLSLHLKKQIITSMYFRIITRKYLISCLYLCTFHLPRFRECLYHHHIIVMSFYFHKIFVVTVFNYCSVFEYENYIYISYSCKSVCYDNCCSALLSL